MTAPTAPHTPDRSGTLLLVGLFGFGHFPVYASNLTLWAHARGLDVVYVSLGQHDNCYLRKFAEHPGVRLCSLASLGFPDFPSQLKADVQPTLKRFGEHWRAILAAAFARFSPSHAVLLHADHLFFERDEVCSAELTLPGPVWAISTFGHREAHTGIPEPYARRLKQALRQRQGFRGVFSIDEQHVRDCDPEEQFLRLLPDPYREFHAANEPLPGPEERAELDALRAFLEQDQRPVLPLLGKFDRRKNNLWTLRAAEANPGLRLVVLGQRVPDEETDPETDALLASLERQGRLFVRFGYVAQSLFQATLASPRTACLPLPYRNHYGSSGIQLMGAEYGLPVLVPEMGLMAGRVARHNLGRVFGLGDYQDFQAQLDLLAREGRSPYAAHCARFISGFGFEPLCAALDRALLGRALPASPLLAPDAGKDDPVARALSEDQPGLALALLEGPGAATPALRGSPAGQVLRRAVLLWRTGQQAAAGEDFRLCHAAGLSEELRFFSSLVMDAARDEADHGDVQAPLARTESWLAALFSLQETARKKGRAEFVQLVAKHGQAPLLGADFWERLGGLYVRSRELAAGEGCFRQAMRLSPDDLDLYLTLSDVLRYQGRDQESLAVLDALEERAPKQHGLRHKRGQVLLQLGRNAEAAALFRAEPRESAHWEAAQRLLRGMPGLT